MVASPQNTRIENQILHFSKQQQWDKVDSLWPNLAEAPSKNPKFYAIVGNKLVKADKTDTFKNYARTLVEACQTLDEPKILLQAARGILRVLPEFEEMRQPVIDALRSQYEKKIKDLDAYMDASGLLTRENIEEALKRFLQFAKCAPGEVFSHIEWGEGVVQSIDPEKNEVHITFAKLGDKTFSFQGANEFLKRVAPSHLYAQRLKRPERLKKNAKEDPVGFIKYCLKCLGGKASRADLKAELTKGVFTTREWNSWWSKNRDAFRFDPYLAVTGSAASAKLTLRKEPRSYYEEVLEQITKAPGLSNKHKLISEALRLKNHEPIPAPIAEKIAKSITQNLESAQTEAQAIEYTYMLEDLVEATGNHALIEGVTPTNDIIAEDDHPVDLLTQMEITDNQLRTAKALKAAQPEQWTHRAEEIVLSAPSRLGQWVFRDMIANDQADIASHIVEQLLHRPYENPSLFIWTANALRDNKLSQLHVDISKEALYAVSLEMIEENQRRIAREDSETASLRAMNRSLQNFLTEGHFAIISNVMEALEPDEARKRYRALMESNALSEGFKVALDQVLRSVRSDLDEGETDTGKGEHLVTAETFQERQAEYQHIKNTEIPENSEAIGRAAAMGDLSENAEYDSAKERQKVLFRRIESLEDLLQRARVIDPSDINNDEIGFGTRFEIKNLDSGEIEEYTLLGIWDADPDNSILSYITPFGRQFMKRKVGDMLVVVRPGGGSTQYKVLKIENALK
jgi:transcription elongation factor GreA